MNPSILTPPRIHATCPPHTEALVADGIRHCCNEQCRPGKNADGKMTFQTECHEQIVYDPKWRDHEASSIDCPKCFRPGGSTDAT